MAAAALPGSVTGAALGAETTQGMPTGAVSGAETAPGMPTDSVQGAPAEAVGLSGTESAAAEATSVAAAGAAAQWKRCRNGARRRRTGCRTEAMRR